MCVQKTAADPVWLECGERAAGTGKQEVVKWRGQERKGQGSSHGVGALVFTLSEFRRPWRVLTNGRCHLAFFNKIMFAPVSRSRGRKRVSRYIHTYIYKCRYIPNMYMHMNNMYMYNRSIGVRKPVWRLSLSN